MFEEGSSSVIRIEWAGQNMWGGWRTHVSLIVASLLYYQTQHFLPNLPYPKGTSSSSAMYQTDASLLTSGMPPKRGRLLSDANDSLVSQISRNMKCQYPRRLDYSCQLHVCGSSTAAQIWATLVSWGIHQSRARQSPTDWTVTGYVTWWRFPM